MRSDDQAKEVIFFTLCRIGFIVSLCLLGFGVFDSELQVVEKMCHFPDLIAKREAHCVSISRKRVVLVCDGRQTIEDKVHTILVVDGRNELIQIGFFVRVPTLIRRTF